MSTFKNGYLVASSSFQNCKSFDYHAKCKLSNDSINMDMILNSKLILRKKNSVSNGKTVNDRIDKLEIDILISMNTKTYKKFYKQHLALVIPTIKTNVIMKLWDYLQSHIATDTNEVREYKDYQENRITKDYVDDIFLLNYFILSSLD